MNIFQLLFESKLEYIARSQGAKLEQRAKEDTGSEMPAVDVLNKLLAADPTGSNGKYLQWIANQYLKGQFKLEDTSRIKGEIETFQSVSPKLDKKDINQYKSLPDLYDALKPFEGQEVVSNREEDRRQEQAFYKSGEAVLIASTPNKIIELHSEAAAKYFGRGTKWCTAADEDNMFNHYYNAEGEEFDEEDEEYGTWDDDPMYAMYVIIHNGKKFQYHPHSSQFMDAQDQPVSREDAKSMLADPNVKKLFDEEYGECAKKLKSGKLFRINIPDFGVLDAYDPKASDIVKARMMDYENAGTVEAATWLQIWFKLTASNKPLGARYEKWITDIYPYNKDALKTYNRVTGRNLPEPQGPYTGGEPDRSPG